MNDLLKIFKINFLSIIALPFFFISTISKMVAKALEKMTVMLTTALYAGLFLLFFHLVDFPSSSKEILKFIFLLLGYLVIIFAISFFLLHLLAGLLSIIWNAIMTIFDSIYRNTYQYYLSILEICQSEYSYVLMNSNPIIKVFSCLFFSMLRLINGTIMFFLKISLFLSIVSCFLAIWYSYYLMDQKVFRIFGYHIPVFIKKYDTFSIVYGIIILLCILAIIGVTLISLGIEWHEWSKEMKMAIPEYHKRIEEIKADLEEANSSLYAVEPYRSYMADLAFHVDALSEMEPAIDAILEQNNDPLLHSLWSRYVINIQEIFAVCSPDDGEPSKEDFNIMIPRIQKLDHQKREIDHILKRTNISSTPEEEPVDA